MSASTGCAAWCRVWLGPQGRPDFAAATRLAAAAAPGSSNVVFTPWLRGERSPVDDRHARAGLPQPLTDHRPSRAGPGGPRGRGLQQPVAPRRGGAVRQRRLDPVRMVGGGALSDLWCQIHADVMDRTIERVEAPLAANLRGAAIFAGLALGAVRSERGAGARAGWTGCSVPIPPTGPPTTACTPSIPSCTPRSAGMFARLNRRRAADRSDWRRAGRGRSDVVWPPAWLPWQPARSEPGPGRTGAGARDTPKGDGSMRRVDRWMIARGGDLGADCSLAGVVGSRRSIGRAAPMRLRTGPGGQRRASFTGHGSIDQAYLLGGPPGTTALLVDGRGTGWAVGPSTARGA